MNDLKTDTTNDLTRRRGRAFATVLTLILTACASNPPAPVEDLSSGSSNPSTKPASQLASQSHQSGSYRVESGDTLYAIAFKRGLDYRDLAAWNGIAAPYRIYAGKELRLSAPDVSMATLQMTAPLAPKPSRIAAPVPPAASVKPPVKPVVAATQASGMFQDVPPEQAGPVSAPGPAQLAVAPSASAPAAAGEKIPASISAPAKPAESEIKPMPGRPADAANVVWHWPNGGKVTSNFASGDMLKTGIDIAGNAGDQVLAAADGEVVYSGNGLIGYGELVIVKHNDSFLSAYGHNRKRLVQEHDRVRAGQPIAEMGSSSASRDELHFEIRKNGKPVNPMDYLPAR